MGIKLPRYSHAEGQATRERLLLTLKEYDMTDENIKVIEINGIKLEVDMRTAKRIDQFKVGDKVKFLTADTGYGSKGKHHIHPGVIVGFENFKNLPTIVIAYLSVDYSEANLKFAYINAESENIDMVSAEENYLPIEKAWVVERMDRDIAKKEVEVEELKRKKAYFLHNFNKYFVPENVDSI